MAERLLTEREVLNATGWPSRQYLDSRIKSDAFPRPSHRLYGIGDQWREADVDAWISGQGTAAPLRARTLEERFGGGTKAKADRRAGSSATSSPKSGRTAARICFGSHL
jgi:predicted DNA-binding transcriptional regulator AlpA